jgi:hypothetical protein
MSLPLLEKHDIRVDDFEFLADQMSANKLTWKGVVVDNAFEFFKPLDLPASYLQRNTVRKIKLVPQMLEAALEDDKIKNLVVLTADGKPSSIFNGDRQIMQYESLFEYIDSEAKKINADDTKYKLLSDGTLKVQSWINNDVLQVTQRVGDSLRFGTNFRYKPGEVILASSLCERLICLNGATRVLEKHTWRGGNDVESQKQFISQKLRVAAMSNAHIRMAAMLLSASKLPEGQSPEEFIRQLCQSFGIIGAMVEAIVLAFNADGDVDFNNISQWDIVNAFTHAFTHMSAPEKHMSDIAGAIMYEVGTGTALVDARVPKMIAEIWGQN